VLFLHYDGSVEWQLLYELLSLATLVHSYWLVTNGVANLLVTSILPLGWLRKLLWLQSTWNLVANCIKNGGEWPPQSKYTPTNGIINWNGIIMNGKFIVNVIIILIWVHLQIYCEYECEYELEYCIGICEWWFMIWYWMWNGILKVKIESEQWMYKWHCTSIELELWIWNWNWKMWWGCPQSGQCKHCRLLSLV